MSGACTRDLYGASPVPVYNFLARCRDARSKQVAHSGPARARRPAGRVPDRRVERISGRGSGQARPRHARTPHRHIRGPGVGDLRLRRIRTDGYGPRRHRAPGIMQGAHASACQASRSRAPSCTATIQLRTGNSHTSRQRFPFDAAFQGLKLKPVTARHPGPHGRHSVYRRCLVPAESCSGWPVRKLQPVLPSSSP